MIIPAVKASIWESGLETNDFSEWTGTSIDGQSSLSVVSTSPHHGSYCAYANSSGSDGDTYAYSYKSLDSATTYFTRFYVNISSFSLINSEYIRLIRYSCVSGEVYNNPLRVGIYGETPHFRLYFLNGSTSYYKEYTGLTVQQNTWYCVEVEVVIDGTDGEAHLWIGGVEVLSETGIDTDNYGNVNRVDIGAVYIYDSGSYALSYDCVVVDSSYIGEETEGGKNLTFTMYENLKGFAQPIRNIELYRVFYEKTKGFSSSTFLRELGFSISEIAHGLSSVVSSFEFSRLDLLFILFEGAKATGSMSRNIEKSFLLSAISKGLASMIPTFEGIAFEITFTLFETARGVALISTTIAEELSLNDVYLMAILGVVLAIVAICIAVAYKI